MIAKYFPVISDPAQAHKVDRAMVALHRIDSNFRPPDYGWMLDSGGYQQITKRGEYDRFPHQYVREIMRLGREVGHLICAFQQDFVVSEGVGNEIYQEGFHDRYYKHLANKSTERYMRTQSAARRLGCEVDIAPVLHGRSIEQYLSHAEMIGGLPGPAPQRRDVIGIGSLKAEKDDIGSRPTPSWMRELTIRLRSTFPRARFHALGVGKKYVLSSVCGATLQRDLWSFDTAAWSVAARYNEDWTTGDNHDVENARRYGQQIENDAVLPS